MGKPMEGDMGKPIEYERLKVVGVRVERSLLERIDAIARETGKNRSIVIREILEEYFRGGTRNVHGFTDGLIIGDIESLGLSEKLELFKRLGRELVEICKEQKRKLRREYPRVSLFELVKYTDCPKISKALSELRVAYSEDVWASIKGEA